MKGLLTLSENILCEKEVLGKSYECTIAGLKVYIHFPRYPLIDEMNPQIGIINPLLPPEIGAGWKRGGTDLSWGYPMRFPGGKSSVEALAISVNCEEKVVNEYAMKLYSSIQRWEHAFVDYLKVRKKQGVERDKNIGCHSCMLELWDKEYVSNDESIALYVLFPAEDSYASDEDIIGAIDYADSKKEMYLEYQMLLSAYDARRQNQNRRAIIDACSALEMTLVKEIDNYCRSKNIPSQLFTNKYRSLGDRIALIKEIDSNFPQEDFDNIVVKPRNDIMHNRTVFPSDDTTDKMLKCVEVVLKHYHLQYY